MVIFKKLENKLGFYLGIILIITILANGGLNPINYYVAAVAISILTMWIAMALTLNLINLHYGYNILEECLETIEDNKIYILNRLTQKDIITIVLFAASFIMQCNGWSLDLLN